MFFHGRFCSTCCVSSFTGWQWRNNALHLRTCSPTLPRARARRPGRSFMLACLLGCVHAGRELYWQAQVVRPVKKIETTQKARGVRKARRRETERDLERQMMETQLGYRHWSFFFGACLDRCLCSFAASIYCFVRVLHWERSLILVRARGLPSSCVCLCLLPYPCIWL